MSLNCNICPKKFSLKQNLRRHVRTFHPANDESEDILTTKCVSSTHQCLLCKITFTRGTSLRRHIKKFHPAENINLIYKDNKNFKCNECDKSFTHMTNLQHHKRVAHKKQSPVTKFLHKCVFCEFFDRRRHPIVKHYEENHSITIESEELEFNNQIEFEIWKKEMEKVTSTFFSKVSSSSLPGDGYKRLKFVCNRSGYYESKGKGLRKLRNQGTLKINGICPAEIDVLVYENNKHIVQHIKSHCGHKNDYSKQYLTKNQRESVAIKITAGVPFRVILDEVRDSMRSNTKLERVNRLSRKDLYNIAKCFQLENESRVSVDSLSIKDWVKEMSEKDCVIYHKLKGSFCNICVDLLEDDFVIMIMNQGQREILEKYSSSCICIDRTHYLNNDKMELISLFVLDDEKKGFPCAFLISNRIDTETISLFYAIIKKKIGKELKTDIFMSDPENMFYSSWMKVMGIPRFRIFCPWHLEKAWRYNLQKISSRKVQSAVYDDLKCLEHEEDSKVFTSNLAEFVENWSTEETLEFLLYFQENFECNHESWAQYFKVENGLYLSNDLKTVHEDVSKLFVFGKNNNRLNMAITAIMNYVTSRLFEIIARWETST